MREGLWLVRGKLAVATPWGGSLARTVAGAGRAGKWRGARAHRQRNKFGTEGRAMGLGCSMYLKGISDNPLSHYAAYGGLI